MTRFFRWVDLLTRGAGALAAGATFTMTLIVVYLVVMRFVFRKPPVWAHEVAGYLLLFMGMMSMAYVLYYDRHVRVDFVFLRLPVRAQHVLRIVTYSLALLLFFAFLTKLSGDIWLDHLRGGERSHFTVLRTPLWWSSWLVPAGAALMCLQLLSRIYHSILVLRGKEK